MRSLSIRGATGGLVVLLLVVACGGADLVSPSEATTTSISSTTETSVTTPTDDSAFVDEEGFSIDWHYLCSIITAMRRTQGAVVGTVLSVESGLPPMPWNADTGREHVLIDVAIEEVAAGTRDHSEMHGGPMPSLLPGETARILLYPDNLPTPLAPVETIADAHGRAVVLLGAAGDPAQPDTEGIWVVRRVIELAAGTVRFQGPCGDTLDATITTLAEILGRPADSTLMMDYQAEVLARYDSTEAPGPIEQAAFDIEAPDTTAPPGDA